MALLHRTASRFCLLALGLMCCTLAIAQSDKTAVTVLTNYWPPYINKADEELGSAAKVLDMIGLEMGRSIEWKQLPYDYTFDLVKSGRAQAGFPYFKTAQRAQHVLFSAPVFRATSQIYYNRQFMREQIQSDNIANYRIGKVAGYSYGSQIDPLLNQAVIYPTELQAIAALFAHEVDLLPMTEGVMNELLARYYPDRTQLIKAVPDLIDFSSLHLIAPDNTAGQQLIAQTNQALDRLREAKLITDKLAVPEVYPADIARLLPGEGYPAILGRLTEAAPHQYLTLPIGTKVIVTEWSPKILRPDPSDRLFRNMNELSKVVVLNGPHIGKTLSVRNLHINLE